MRKSVLGVLFFIFIFAGILDSAYLLISSCLISSCFTGSGGVCPVGGSCCKFHSFYSLLGLLWFTAGATFVFRPEAARFRDLSFTWSLLGVAGVSYLVFLEVYTYDFCPLCTVAHLSGIGAVLTLNSHISLSESESGSGLNPEGGCERE